MGKGNLDVISPLQPLGDDVRHFVILSREGAERFKKDQAFDFLGERGGIKQAHTAAKRVTDDRKRFFLQMLYKPREIGKKILMLITPARGRPLTVAVTP